MKFSVLICHLRQREALLRRLLDVITPQLTPAVEFLVDATDKQTTGTKRNALLARAAGDYIAFIDDDDLVSDDYVPRILGAIESKPDVVGIEGVITHGPERLNPRWFICSMRYDNWFEQDGVYCRSPNHLCPVRRELAIAAGFPDLTSGEDHEYSRRLYPMLKTETYLAGAMYFYLAESA